MHSNGRKPQHLAIIGAPLSSFHWRSSWKADSQENAEFSPFPTLSHLSYSRPKPDRFPVSRDRVAESKSTFSTTKIPAYQIGVIVGDTRSMENNDRTMKELATLDMVYQLWCIQCPPLEPAQNYKLKSSLIHLLPKFHDLVGEDPH
ncbi:hypothetical protein CR513_32083, partial [Mucuna pruriens]